MKQQEVPDILIEQYALGELSDENARSVEQSPGFAERLRLIHESNSEILDRYSPEVFASRIKNQFEAEESRKRAAAPEQKPARRPLRWLVYAMPGAAAVAVAAVFAVQMLFAPGTGIDQSGLNDTVRLKGSLPELSVFRLVDGPQIADDDAERLGDGSVAKEGDQLQLAYNSGDRPYGIIVSVDGRGAVFVHFPYELSAEPKLVAGRTQQLAVGYKLDDAPRFEHFFLITARETFSVQQLVQTIRSRANQITERADSLKLDETFEITSVTILKGE